MPVSLDTVKVENGKFEIKGKVTEPAFHTLILQGANGPIPLILESGEIKVTLIKTVSKNLKFLELTIMMSMYLSLKILQKLKKA
ncbi:hypothetical protein AAGS39_19580 [Flavobacterium sp. CGRL2]